METEHFFNVQDFLISEGTWCVGDDVNNFADWCPEGVHEKDPNRIPKRLKYWRSAPTQDDIQILQSCPMSEHKSDNWSRRLDLSSAMTWMSRSRLLYCHEFPKCSSSVTSASIAVCPSTHCVSQLTVHSSLDQSYIRELTFESWRSLVFT